MEKKDIKKALEKKNVHLVFHWTEPDEKNTEKGYINTMGSINFINEKGEEDSIGFRLPADEIAKGLSQTIVKLIEEATFLYNKKLKEIEKAEKTNKNKKNGKSKTKKTKDRTNRKTKKSV